MINDLKNAISRNPAALLGDFAGATALLVVIVGALHLPGLT